MSLTAKGQTIGALSIEFIAAMKMMSSGSADMDVMFDNMVAKENDMLVSNGAKMLAAISDVAGTGFDARTIPLIAKNKVRVTNTLLAWICLQSRGIPEFISTMLGLYATHFYSQYPSTHELSLRWVGDTVGKGKLVDFRQFFPWAAASKNAEGKNIFEHLEDAELFTYTKSK